MYKHKYRYTHTHKTQVTIGGEEAMKERCLCFELLCASEFCKILYNRKKVGRGKECLLNQE